MTKSITKLYVKSMDGTRWYVGDSPCEPHRGSGFQLGAYYYGATDGDANNNLMRARSYARGLVCGEPGKYELVDYGMNEAFTDRPSAEWQGKCEAQRQVRDYQDGIFPAVTGTANKNPYPVDSREWTAYECAFSDFINMAFERE